METTTVQVDIQAAPEKVWDILADYESYAQFPYVTDATLVSPGQPTPAGQGAVRTIHFGPLSSITAFGIEITEEITVFDAPRRLEYRIVQCSLPVHHETASIELEKAGGGGTRVLWKSTYTVDLPVFANLIERTSYYIVTQVFEQILLSIKESLEPGSVNISKTSSESLEEPLAPVGIFSKSSRGLHASSAGNNSSALPG